MKLKCNISLISFIKETLLFMLFFPRFKPLFIEHMPEMDIINIIYKLMLVISIFVSMFMYIWLMSKKKVLKKHFGFLFSTLLYFMIFIISSLINNQFALVNIIGSIASIISFIMLIQITFIYYGKEIITLVSHFLQLLIIINSVIYWFKPYGLVQSSYYGNYIHFLANRNGLILIYFVVIAIMITDYYIRENKLSFKKKIWIATIGLTIVPFKSGTATLCIIGMLIVMFVSNNIVRWFSYLKVWIIYAIVTVIMVFMRVTEYFEFIFSLVGKDTTLTGRTIIWKAAEEMITESFKSMIWGYGATTSITFYFNGKLLSSHNMIIEMLLRGGAIALLMYIVVIIYCKKEHSKERKVNYQYNCYINVILLFALLASLTETPVFSPYIFIIMTLINISSDLVKASTKERMLC